MPHFHLKTLGYEEVKNPEEKPNMGAVEAKRLYLERGGGGGGAVNGLFMNKNRN